MEQGYEREGVPDHTFVSTRNTGPRARGEAVDERRIGRRQADRREFSVTDESLVLASETGARNGSKHHLLVDATGVPLAWTVSGGNRHDITQLIPLVERVPQVRGKVGRPRKRPDRLIADRGYDHDKYRRELRRRGIRSSIARRQTKHGSGLGRVRWVVERTFAWLHHFKRLLVRYDRRAEIHDAFLAIGCCLVCFRRGPELIVIRVLREGGRSCIRLASGTGRYGDGCLLA